ncbi:MAG: hypothetical protein ACYDDF_08950 [Thermoplasmatota archaeon]
MTRGFVAGFFTPAVGTLGAFIGAWLLIQFTLRFPSGNEAPWAFLIVLLFVIFPILVGFWARSRSQPVTVARYRRGLVWGMVTFSVLALLVFLAFLYLIILALRGFM